LTAANYSATKSRSTSYIFPSGGGWRSGLVRDNAPEQEVELADGRGPNYLMWPGPWSGGD